MSYNDKKKSESKLIKVELARPFLRWAGGKRWLIKTLLNELPESFNNYYEPFLGAGNIFFSINNKFKKCFLTDINIELITSYNEIKNNLNALVTELKKLKNNKKFYYEIRRKKYKKSSKIAARFIYLNKTCFNGIYRVNSKGNFNVPYGYRKNVKLVDKKSLKQISQVLAKTSIKVDDFENALKSCKKGDFVFLDPPYTVAHERNGFLMYNSKIFTWDDQERLSKVFKDLTEKGCFVILCNASHSSIKKLYKDFDIKTVRRKSLIAGESKRRTKINEYLIKNY